jgi:FkbM family methyltransferase
MLGFIKHRGKQGYQWFSGQIVESVLNPVNYNGIIIDANCGAIDTKNKARFFPYYFFNEHSIREKRLIDRHLPRDDPVIELGGGIGYISAYIDKKIGDRETQIVVEPNPDNVSCNKKTRNLNDSDYVLLEGAYSPNDSMVNLNINNKFSNGSTVKKMSNKQIEVEGFSLSNICSEYDLKGVTLLSDMEGGEFSMIDKELETLSDSVLFAIIEFHPFEEFTEDEYVDKMVSAGFEELDDIGGTHAFKNTNLTT